MNLEDARKEFIKYFKNFDIKNKEILSKFHHSFRVMEYSNFIAKSLDLNESDVLLANVIGLLHDIGRFEQIRDYNTYYDYKSVDYGDNGAKILLKDNFISKFSDNSEIQSIIINSVKTHNKIKADGKNERELFFSKIIRDADKIDIIIEQSVQIKNNDLKLKEEILNILENKSLVPNNLIENDLDDFLRHIGFIYDLNFKFSFKILLDKEIIQNKFNLLKIYFDKDVKRLDNIEKIIINYMKERC